jgi:hypothetical protein
MNGGHCAASGHAGADIGRDEELEDAAYEMRRADSLAHTIRAARSRSSWIDDGLSILDSWPESQARDDGRAWLTEARDALGDRNAVLHGVPMRRSDPSCSHPESLRAIRQRLEAAYAGWTSVVLALDLSASVPTIPESASVTGWRHRCQRQPSSYVPTPPILGVWDDHGERDTFPDAGEGESHAGRFRFLDAPKYPANHDALSGVPWADAAVLRSWAPASLVLGCLSPPRSPRAGGPAVGLVERGRPVGAGAHHRRRPQPG